MQNLAAGKQNYMMELEFPLSQILCFVFLSFERPKDGAKHSSALVWRDEDDHWSISEWWFFSVVV